MQNIIEQAKFELNRIENCTLVVLNRQGKIVYRSTDRGIRPAVDAVFHMKGAVVADKVIGKAAALICIYGGASYVFGKVMSVEAQKVLEQNKIGHGYEKLTDSILNSDKSAACPMEALVKDISSPKEAYEAIYNKINAKE
ncbi:MAG: DUF1893 domain-containing protein [Eubacteriales bacterium]|jgi:hypothetical protein|nr:DUF1893 domain-containing protein [Eubacteriales bacterium]